MGDLKKKIIENGHDYGVRAQIAGTAFVTSWEFFNNKIDVATPADQIMESMPIEDYAEYIGIMALISFGPLFYHNKIMAHLHPNKEKREEYKNKEPTTADLRRKAYISSGFGLAILSGVAFSRGKMAAGLTFGAGSLLNFITAGENNNFKEGSAKKKPFRKSGYGYLLTNIINLSAGIAAQNPGVIISNSFSAIGSVMIAESEPKPEPKKETAKIKQEAISPAP